MNYRKFLAEAEARAAEAAPAPVTVTRKPVAPVTVTRKPVAPVAPVIIPAGERIAPARKPVAPIAVNHYFGKLAPMGEAAAALMYTQAHVIAYVALDTLYQRQKTPRLFELRNDVCKLSRLNGIDARLDAAFAVHTMTKAVRHVYKLRKIKATGKMFRQECRPYTTRELSNYGKAHNAAARYALDIRANLDGEDIIQEAAARYMELYQSGLIQTFGDFAAVARLVFRAVNRYIAAQSRRDKKQAAAPAAREAGHDDTELTWTKAPAARKAPASPIEAAAVAADTKAAVIAAIVKHAHHNVDKVQLARIASLLVDGYSQSEIAELLKVSKMAVSRAVVTIGKAAEAAAPVIESILNAPAEAPAEAAEAAAARAAEARAEAAARAEAEARAIAEARAARARAIAEARAAEAAEAAAEAEAAAVAAVAEARAARARAIEKARKAAEAAEAAAVAAVADNISNAEAAAIVAEAAAEAEAAAVAVAEAKTREAAEARARARAAAIVAKAA